MGPSTPIRDLTAVGLGAATTARIGSENPRTFLRLPVTLKPGRPAG